MNFNKRAVLENSLCEWYEADATRQRLFDDIVSGRAGVSLRLVDWAVTNYSARKPVLYEYQGKLVDMNSDYKDVLRCFHKMGFDSFRRRGEENPQEATLRQKNFFRWAIANGVVDYVMSHTKELETDMISVKRGKRLLPPAEREEGPRRQKQKTTPAVLIRDHPCELAVPGTIKLDW